MDKLLLEDLRGIVALLEDPREIYKRQRWSYYLEIKRLLKLRNLARQIATKYDFRLTRTKLLHNRIDRKLAEMDGRYKVVEPHYHRSEDRPIDAKRLVKKLSQSEKEKLIDELMKHFERRKA